MQGVMLQDVLAFLVGSFQQGAARGLREAFFDSKADDVHMIWWQYIQCSAVHPAKGYIHHPVKGYAVCRSVPGVFWDAGIGCKGCLPLVVAAAAAAGIGRAPASADTYADGAAAAAAGALEDDAVLEAVVLLGALAGWQEGDRELADSGLVRTTDQ
jgi:hypothetical protein